jgi:hypothetical protein
MEKKEGLDLFMSYLSDYENVPTVLNEETVNQMIYDNGRSYTLLRLLVDSQNCTTKILREFLRWKPRVTFDALFNCLRWDCFHILLQYQDCVNLGDEYLVFKTLHG